MDSHVLLGRLSIWPSPRLFGNGARHRRKEIPNLEDGFVRKMLAKMQEDFVADPPLDDYGLRPRAASLPYTATASGEPFSRTSRLSSATWPPEAAAASMGRWTKSPSS